MKHEFSLKKIIQLTFPSFLSQATLMLVGIVDMYFAGTIGTSAISALAIAHTTWNMVAAFLKACGLELPLLPRVILAHNDTKTCTMLVGLAWPSRRSWAQC